MDMLGRLSLAALCLWCGAAFAQSVDAPNLKPGDSWVVSRTVDHGPKGWSQKNISLVVDHLQHDAVAVDEKLDGSPQPPIEKMMGLDWSYSHDVNGKEQVVKRPASFPMEPGKKWTLEYTQLNPNPQHSSETIHCDYVVTGWEDVDVPAGHFKALKVECDGHWSAEVAAAVTGGSQAVATASGVATVSQTHRIVPHSVEGRLYDAYWYVPSQKYFVKQVEDSYNTQGVRTEHITQELVSSKLVN
jgi:hypothetical protein